MLGSFSSPTAPQEPSSGYGSAISATLSQPLSSNPARCPCMCKHVQTCVCVCVCTCMCPCLVVWAIVQQSSACSFHQWEVIEWLRKCMTRPCWTQGQVHSLCLTIKVNTKLVHTRWALYRPVIWARVCLLFRTKEESHFPLESWE
jgi:hypothetical protein